MVQLCGQGKDFFPQQEADHKSTVQKQKHQTVQHQIHLSAARGKCLVNPSGIRGKYDIGIFSQRIHLNRTASGSTDLHLILLFCQICQIQFLTDISVNKSSLRNLKHTRNISQIKAKVSGTGRN